MSGPASFDERPIADENACIEFIKQGEKPAANWRIGAEHEKFILDAQTNRPLSYDGTPGIGALLAEIAEDKDFTPYREHGKLIALQIKEGGSITLEPGGQLELSGAPLANLHQMCMETNRHLSLIKAKTSKIGAKILSMGFFPELERKDFHWMPKPRYKIMRDYMPKRGSLGHDMMLRTCTVQVNLDFGSEADFVKKMRVSTALQPIATALFASSPFIEGRPSGYKSWRSHIWTDTDPDRCGIPKTIFDDDFSYRAWVNYILDVPMYFIHRQDQNGSDIYHDVSGSSFRDFLRGTLKLPDGSMAGTPNHTDFANHLTTAFPEVRAKQFIEMRGADAGPWRNLCALPALWVGLLYDAKTLDDAYDWIKDWSYEEVAALRTIAPKDGLDGVSAHGKIHDLARKMVELANQGLAARGILNYSGNDERSYLEPLQDIVETGKTLADRMLQDFDGAWGGNIAKVYDQSICCE
ncbi:MAG: glutamate--cysteine ligase [Alphaproteobacteria bacterium]